MKKIILATIGLAIFATPLAAQNPRGSYPPDEAFRTGPTAFTSNNYARAAQQRPALVPSGATSTFGLTPPRPHADFRYSRSGPRQNQDLRYRYGRISR